jgi:hypothetical protein
VGIDATLLESESSLAPGDFTGVERFEWHVGPSSFSAAVHPWTSLIFNAQ